MFTTNFWNKCVFYNIPFLKNIASEKAFKKANSFSTYSYAYRLYEHSKNIEGMNKCIEKMLIHAKEFLNYSLIFNLSLR